MMLLNDVNPTHGVASHSLQLAKSGGGRVPDPDMCPLRADEVDAFVQESISATNGIMYRSLVNKLKEYPIPDLRIPLGKGELFLEIGSNWGRWCIAAARKGYSPVGIDPSLEAILSAVRVAKQLGIRARFLVGDARYLPFRDNLFDFVFSYSVLQHFDKGDARESLSEVERVLKWKCSSMIQMPNIVGLRCLYNQLKRGFREAKDFDVRYWSPSELTSTFTQLIGPSALSVDGFLSLNAQRSEAHLLPWKFRVVVILSDALREAACRVRPLSLLADSLFITSGKDNVDTKAWTH